MSARRGVIAALAGGAAWLAALAARAESRAQEQLFDQDALPPAPAEAPTSPEYVAEIDEAVENMRHPEIDRAIEPGPFFIGPCGNPDCCLCRPTVAGQQVKDELAARREARA